MAAIKNNLTDEVIIVAETPRFINGIWECGDQRFTDPDGADYSPVPPGFKISPIAFKLLFTPAERIKAKQLRVDDPVLEDFWGLLDDPRTDVVDLELTSVQNAVEYTLTKVKAAGVDIDVEVRKAEIFAGQVQ